MKGTSNTVGANVSTTNVGFGVFGYKINNTWSSSDGDSATPNFMYNQQVKWNTTSETWKYTPIKYWPNGTDAANESGAPSNTATSTNTDKLNFFAYAPYVELTTSDLSDVGITMINGYARKGGTAAAGETPANGNQKTGDPTVEYKLSTSDVHATSNVDLLWGLRGDASYSETDNSASTGTIGSGYNTDLTKQTVSEKVAFQFKHALAKIGGKSGLKIVADIDGNGAGLGGFGTLDSKTCITVRSITIKNKGNENFKESGTFDLATGTWSNLTDAASQPANGALINESINTSGTGTIAMNSDIYDADGERTYSSGWSSPSGVTTTAKDVYDTDGQDAFYLIPGSSVTLQVAINYDITTYDENVNGNYVKINQTITNDVTVAVPETATNKFYTLVLHLGLTSVKFSAAVADWDGAEAGAVEEVWLPSNVVDASTSITLAAGASSTVNTAASTTNYTINLTGLKNSTTVTTTHSGVATNATASYKDSGSNVGNDNKATVNVTLPANTSTSATASSTITITGKDSSNADFTTVVTIIQAKAAS